MLSLFPQIFAYQTVALFVLRLVLAVIFLASGYSKLFQTFGQTVKFFDSVRIKPAKFWVVFVGSTEILCGLMLGFGFLTQLAAALVVAIMLVAIVKVKFRQGFLGGYDFDLLILVCALLLLFSGPGAFSFDLPL